MIKYLFITSFHAAGYKQYGRRFLEGFKKHFPQSCILACFHEGEEPPVDAKNIWYFDLNKDAEHQAFKTKHKDNPAANGVMKLADGRTVLDYRWQAVRFSNKIAALTSPDLPSSEWRVWIDADIIVEKAIPLSFFDGLLSDRSIVAQYIGRPKEVWHTSECGWVAYNTSAEDGKHFLKDFRKCYLKDEVFNLAETHDSFVFDRMREHYEEQGCKFHDIAAGLSEFHPWPHTALGQYMNHLKGPAAKNEFADKQPIDVTVHSISTDAPRRVVKTKNPPRLSFSAKKDVTRLDIIKIAEGCKNRYQQINNVIAMTEPKQIVEVGTFKGDRAIEMCSVMLSQKKPVHYIGFDIFEAGDEEMNKAELNGKGNSVYAEVVKKLDDFRLAHDGLFTFELFQGNTKETLANMDLGAVDFAFIDGGHSVETIQNDYDALSDAKVIIFDDFYLAGHDITKFGCNTIVEKIPHSILAVADNFGKQKIGLVLAGKNVMIEKPLLAKDVKDVGDGAIKIKTRNCVESDVIHNNIRYSAKYARQAKVKDIASVDFSPAVLAPIDDTYVFVGGGGSVLEKQHSQYNKNWEAIRALHKEGKRVIGVKTSYDAIIAHGIIPWGCLLLDPRDHVADCIQTPHKDTIYFIASMCDKTTWDKFAGGGYKVLGYHAGVLVGEDKVIKEIYNQFVMIQGGTTSGFRGVSLFYTLGIRNLAMFGFDSSYEGKPAKAHGRSPKEPIQVHVHNKDFWTDPELIAQSQDMEMLTKHLPHLNIKYYGNGMLQHANDTLRDMLTKQYGAREKAPFMFNAYAQALGTNNDLGEALTIDSAVMFLNERKRVVDDTLEKIGTLDAYLAKVVNTGIESPPKE